MPREQINTPTANVVTVRSKGDASGPPGLIHAPLQPGDSWTPEDGGTLEFSPTVWLGWGGAPYPNDPSSSGIVTVTLAVADDEILRRAESIRSRRAEGHDHASPSERMAHFTTHPLTRGEMNVLIRTARRARDKAFGSDE